jgi:glutamyl-tRNA reductase
LWDGLQFYQVILRAEVTGIGGIRVLSNIVTPSTLFAFGINYKTAPVEVREKLHLNDLEIRTFLSLVREELPECLVLSTCNRTEVYGVTDSVNFDIDRFKDLLVDFKGARSYVRDEHFFELISCSACQQLFSVATSIDSKVVGDLQILPQLRSAYSIAGEQYTTGKVLNQLLQRAFKVGKKTFTETSIHEGAVSTSLAAVEMALKIFGSLQDRKVMVLGAGETARLTAEALLNKRVRKLAVSNRTRTHATELLESLECDGTETEVIDFETFRDHLHEVDIVISSTGSELPIIGPADFARLSGSLLIIDIAVPRDVDPAVGELPNVMLRNIDHLHEIVCGNHDRRLKDLPKVKKLIAREMVDFLTWYYTLPLLPARETDGGKSSDGHKSEILRIKQFLNENVSEIHKLYSNARGDFRQDLDSHFALVDRLQRMKAEAFGRAAA